MQSRANHRNRERGFSMIELVVVIAIVLVVAALATPNITRAITNVRLRQSTSGVAGLLQKTRMEAVRTNRIQVMRDAVNGNLRFVYVDAPQGALAAAGNSQFDARESLVQLAQGVQPEFDVAPPAAFPSPQLLGFGLAPSPRPIAVGFNQRGLPCQPGAPGACTISGFLYYFRMASPFGDQWAAISVTPAGRVRVWTYNGTTWI